MDNLGHFLPRQKHQHHVQSPQCGDRAVTPSGISLFASQKKSVLLLLW